MSVAGRTSGVGLDFHPAPADALQVKSTVVGRTGHGPDGTRSRPSELATAGVPPVGGPRVR